MTLTPPHTQVTPALTGTKSRTGEDMVHFTAGPIKSCSDSEF